MTDAMESARQGVQQEAADELVGGKRHDLLTRSTIPAVILVAESYARLVMGNEAAVRDRDAMGVASEIGQHGFWSGKGRLGIDDPALLADRGDMMLEPTVISEVCKSAEEPQLVRAMQGDKPFHEQSPEQHAEHAHRKEERRARGNPTLAVLCDAAARHDHVDMGMMHHGRAPGVKHGGDADLRAEMLRVGGDREHRL